MTDRPIRASDQDRDSVVDVLRDAYTDGRLTLDEFEERTSSAYAAKTWTDLRELTADLPVQPPLGADLHYQPRADLDHWSGAVPPRAVPPPSRPHQARRDHPLGRLLPVVFVWILISAAAGSTDLATVLSIVFISLLACRWGWGRRW